MRRESFSLNFQLFMSPVNTTNFGQFIKRHFIITQSFIQRSLLVKDINCSSMFYWSKKHFTIEKSPQIVWVYSRFFSFFFSSWLSFCEDCFLLFIRMSYCSFQWLLTSCWWTINKKNKREKNVNLLPSLQSSLKSLISLVYDYS